MADATYCLTSADDAFDGSAAPYSAPSKDDAVHTLAFEATTRGKDVSAGSDPWWAFLLTYRSIVKTLVTFAFFGLVMSLHTWATRVSWHRGVVVYNMVGTPPLHDLLHELLPNLQRFRVIPEIGHILPLGYLVGLLLYHFDQRSLDCFRLFLWTHGSLLLMRTASFVSTLLPDASQQCHVSLFVGSCHDLIFSGHVMIMMLSTLFAPRFFYVPPLGRVALVINWAVVSVLVVATRNHYSVDVVVAIFATLFAYVCWTRHPLLLALAVDNPTKVLAKPSSFDPRWWRTSVGGSAGSLVGKALAQALRKDGHSYSGSSPGKPHRPSSTNVSSRPVCSAVTNDGAGTSWMSSRRPVEGPDGYEIIDDAEHLRMVTEYAVAAFSLTGLNPRLVRDTISVTARQRLREPHGINRDRSQGSTVSAASHSGSIGHHMRHSAAPHMHGSSSRARHHQFSESSAAYVVTSASKSRGTAASDSHMASRAMTGGGSSSSPRASSGRYDPVHGSSGASGLRNQPSHTAVASSSGYLRAAHTSHRPSGRHDELSHRHARSRQYTSNTAADIPQGGSSSESEGGGMVVPPGWQRMHDCDDDVFAQGPCSDVDDALSVASSRRSSACSEGAMSAASSCEACRQEMRQYRNNRASELAAGVSCSHQRWQLPLHFSSPPAGDSRRSPGAPVGHAATHVKSSSSSGKRRHHDDGEISADHRSSVRLTVHGRARGPSSSSSVGSYGALTGPSHQHHIHESSLPSRYAHSTHSPTRTTAAKAGAVDSSHSM